MIILKKTDEEKVKIILESTKSSAELSKEIGVPPTTIRNIRRKNGVHLRNSFIKPPIDEFISLYNNLKSSRKVAEYYGTNHKTILDFAKSIGYNTKREKLLSQEEENEIADLYFTSTSINLAEKYGVSQSKIQQIWSQHNLKNKTNRTYYLNEDYFNKIDTSQKAYFLGWIGSDGCLYHPKSNKQDIIRISLQHGDSKILELLKRELNYDKPISIVETSEGKYASLEISSNKMSNDLQKLGLSYRKTYSNTIANISDEFMPHLIRGYFEGDGSFYYPNKSKVRVSISGYEGNLMKINKYLESKNIFSTFILDKREYTNSNVGRFGSLSLSNKMDVFCFLNLIYEECGDFYLNRKYSDYKKFYHYIYNSNNIRDKQIITYYKYAVQKVS